MLFAIAGQGQAILFVVTLAAWTLVSIYLLVLAARTYVVVLQGTAGGIDRVEWPDEPIYDWILTALQFLGVSAIILMPAGFISRALTDKFYPDNTALRYLLILGPFAWLFYPIGLLSSSSGSSRWAVLSPRTLLGLLRIAPSMIVFYFVTALLFVGVGALGYLGLLSPQWYVLPLSVLAMSALWMIHARLVGRLGWLLHEQSRAAAKSNRKPGNKEQRPRKKRVKAIAAEDPWADPEEEEAPPPARSGSMAYRIVEEEEPRPSLPSYVEPPPDPYELSAPLEEPEPAPSEASRVPDERVEREIALRRREPPNPPPAYPLWSGVYQFPLYENCRKPLVYLLLFGALSGAMFRMMMDLYAS